MWAPLWQSDRAVVFTDLRGKLFEDEQREGNFALGYRQMLAGGWNIGAWAGYDARHTALGSLFGQAAFGVELLSANFDVRFNGYLPTDNDKLVGRSTSTATAGQTFEPFAELRGNQVVLVQGGFTTTTQTITETRELALWGLDGEIGAKLPIDLGVDSDVRAYVGGFYFDHADLDEEIIGPRVRLEWRTDDILPDWSGSRLTLETEYQWDEVRDDQFEIGARLRLPFSVGGSTTRLARLTPQERRMNEGLERDTDIVAQSSTSTSSSTNITGQSETVEAVEDALTGVDLDQAVVVANGNNLQTAVDNAGGNSLIIANGGPTAFARTSLLDNQTLMGGGTAINVRGQSSGVVAAFSAAGSRPLINHTVFTQPVVTAANNTHIAGVNITGGGTGTFSFPALNSGVFVPAGTDTVYITNTNISRPHVHGVFVLSNSTNINVIDSNISSDDGNGITGQDNISINVLRTTIGGINGGAFAFNNNVVASLNSVTFEGTRNAGVVVFLANTAQSQVSGANNVNNAVPNTLPACRGEGFGFAGSISFVNGDVWQDNVAPCN